MGVKMMANIIMLGFVIAINKLVSRDAIEKAVSSSVPKPTIEKNMSGLERGYRFGKELITKKK